MSAREGDDARLNEEDAIHIADVQLVRVMALRSQVLNHTGRKHTGKIQPC